MDAIQIERAAYLAAHRILTANTSAPELALLGDQRSRVVHSTNSLKIRIELHNSKTSVMMLAIV